MNRESGTSLLELLVAQALGLMLMAGLLKSLGDGLDQHRQHEDRVQLRESAQIIAVVLQHSLNSAGFVDWTDSRWAANNVPAPGSTSQILPGGAALFACPGEMHGSAAQHANASSATLPRCGSMSSVRETLQVLRHGTSNTQHNKDCLQQGNSGPWVVDRFYINSGSLGTQLLCAGSGNHTGQALVAGVEEWVFRFLVRQPNGHTQWLATSQMGTTDAAQWQRVVRLELCWVMASSASGRGGSQAHRLQNPRPTCQRSPDGQWLAGVARGPNDSRLWQRYTHTVALHNHNTHSSNTP